MTEQRSLWAEFEPITLRAFPDGLHAMTTIAVEAVEGETVRIGLRVGIRRDADIREIELAFLDRARLILQRLGQPTLPELQAALDAGWREQAETGGMLISD